MEAEQLVAALPNGVAPPLQTVFSDCTKWSLTRMDHPPRRSRSAGAGTRRHCGQSLALPCTDAPRSKVPNVTMNVLSSARDQQLRRAKNECGSDFARPSQRSAHQRPCHHRRAVSPAMPQQRPQLKPHRQRDRRPASAAAIIASRETAQAQATIQSTKPKDKLSSGRRTHRTHWVASAPWNPTKVQKEYYELTCRDRVGWSALPDAGDTRIRELGKREAAERAKAYILRRHMQLAAAAQRRAERSKRQALALEAEIRAHHRIQMGFEAESRAGDIYAASNTTIATSASAALAAFAASTFLDTAITATQESNHSITRHSANKEVETMPTKSKAHTRENSAQADLLWRREAEALTEAAKWLRRAGKARAAAELHAKASQSEGHRLVLRAVHALDDGDMLRFVQLAQSSYDMLRHYASSRPAARIIAKARFIETQRNGGGAAAAAIVRAAESEAELIEMLALIVGNHHDVNMHTKNAPRPAGILAAAFALHRASQNLSQSWVRLSAGTINCAVEAHRRANNLLEWLKQWSLAWNECSFPTRCRLLRLSNLLSETSGRSIAAEAETLMQHALHLGQRLRDVAEQHRAASVLQKVYRGVVARRQLEIMVVPMIVVAVRDTKIGDNGASGAAALQRLCAVLTKYCTPAGHAQPDHGETVGVHAASAPLVLEALHQAHAVGVTVGSLTDNSTSPLYVNAAFQFLAQALDASNSAPNSAAPGNFRVQLLTERLCARAIQASEMVVIACLLNTTPAVLKTSQVAARSDPTTIASKLNELKNVIASTAQHFGTLWQQSTPPHTQPGKPTAAQSREILRGASATLAQLLTTCENRWRTGTRSDSAAEELSQALAQHIHTIGGEEIARRTVQTEACYGNDDELTTGALANAGLILTHIFRGSEWLAEKWKTDCTDCNAVYAVQTGLANAPKPLVLSSTAVVVAVELTESLIAHSECWGQTMAELGLQIASAAAEMETMSPVKFKAKTQDVTNLHQRLGKFTAFLTNTLDLLSAIRVRLDTLGTFRQHLEDDHFQDGPRHMVMSAAEAAAMLFSSSINDASIAINAVLKASSSSADLASAIEQASAGLNKTCCSSPVSIHANENTDTSSIAPVLAASLRQQFADLASHASSCADRVSASASKLMRQMFATLALLPPIFVSIEGAASNNDYGQYEHPTPTSIDVWHLILHRSCQRLAAAPNVSSSSAGRVSLAHASEAVRGFWHAIFRNTSTESKYSAATFQRLTSGLQAYASGLVAVSTSKVICSGFATSTSNVKAKLGTPTTLKFFMTALSFASDFAMSISASLAEHGPRPQQCVEQRAATLSTLYWLLPQFTLATMRTLVSTPRRRAGSVHHARLKEVLKSLWRAQLRLTCLSSLAESLSPLPTIVEEKSHKKLAAQVWHRVLQSCAKVIIKEDGLEVLTQIIGGRDKSHGSELACDIGDETHLDDAESKDSICDESQEPHADEMTTSRANVMNASYAERKCISQCRTAAARVLTAVVSAELEPISDASGTSRHTGRELDVIQSLRATDYAQMFMQILQREQLDSELVVHAMLCSRLPYELVGHHMRRGVDVKGELQPLLKSASLLGTAATCALVRFPSEIAVQVAGARMLLSLLRFCAPATQTQAVPEGDAHIIMSEFTGTLLSESSRTSGKNIMVALLGAHRALQDPSILTEGQVESCKTGAPAMTQIGQSLSSKTWADNESNDSSAKLISAAEFRASRRRTSYMAFNSGMNLENARVAAKVKETAGGSSTPHGFDEDADCTAASCALLMLVHHNDTAISVMRNAPVRDTGNIVQIGGLEATADVLECVLGSAAQGDVADRCVFADRLADAGAVNILTAVLSRCAATFVSQSASGMQSLLCACNALYGLASVSEHHCIQVARHTTTTTADTIGLLVEVHKRAAKYETQVNNASCTPLSTSSSLSVRIAIAAMAVLRKMAQQFTSLDVSLRDREWWVERVIACGAADAACSAIKAFPHEIGHAAQAAGFLVVLAAPKVVNYAIPAMLNLISPLTIDTLYSAIGFAAEANVGTVQTQNDFDRRLFKELTRRQNALISRCGGTQGKAQNIANDLHLSAQTMLAALTGWIEPIGDVTRPADVTVEAVTALATFLNRDGLRTITKIIRMTYRCIDDVAQPIVIDCIATCTASISAMNCLPDATELTDADVVAAILEAGVIAAVQKHVIGRCVRQKSKQDICADASAAMTQHQVCDATLSLFGRLLDSEQSHEGQKLCEDINRVLAHVLTQLDGGPLTTGDQLLKRRAETLQARLASTV